MKRIKYATYLMTAFLFVGTTMLASAQESTASQDTHQNVRTITGCLQQGDSANEYNLMGQDGSTWEVKSDTANLSKHVGQTVAVTGAVRNAALHGMKEDTKTEAREHGVDKTSTEHGHLIATDVSVVSSSCQR